jgi:hypothetical protein
LILVTIIDGCPLPFGDRVKEFEAIRVVLRKLACVINFNIIHNLDHPIILGMPWFELHNQNNGRTNPGILGPSQSLTSSLGV